MHVSLMLLVFLFVAVGSCLQAGPETSRRAGAPPKYLNMVHEQLKPGRNSEYDKLLAEIARGFARARIAAYWVDFEFPQERTFALNFFDSLDEQGKIVSALASGYAAHPELVQMADRLLMENVVNVNSVLGVRSDNLSYRVDSIDFAKARILLVTTICVRPGHEEDFNRVYKEKAAACGKSNADIAWVVYRAVYGSTRPTFVILSPYTSFRQMEERLAQEQAIETAGDELANRMNEAVRSAFASVESQAFIASPLCSHVPEEFASGDKEFWTVKS
jgi:hypothetical protein